MLPKKYGIGICCDKFSILLTEKMEVLQSFFRNLFVCTLGKIFTKIIYIRICNF